MSTLSERRMYLALEGAKSLTAASVVSQIARGAQPLPAQLTAAQAFNQKYPMFNR